MTPFDVLREVRNAPDDWTPDWAASRLYEGVSTVAHRGEYIVAAAALTNAALADFFILSRRGFAVVIDGASKYGDSIRSGLRVRFYTPIEHEPTRARVDEIEVS